VTRPMLASALAPVPPFALWAAGQSLAVLAWLGLALLAVDIAAGYAWWTTRRPRTASRPVVVDLVSRRRPHVPPMAKPARKPSPPSGPRIRHV
jgi:hypothetical protein